MLDVPDKLSLGAITRGGAPEPTRRSRSRLFRKFALLFIALVGGSLLVSGGLELWFSYQESKAALAKVQQEKAIAAAARIEQFMDEITRQIGWTSRAQWATSSIEQRRLEYLRLLSQAPAVTEVSHLDGDGREELRISRLAVDAIGSGTDFSSEAWFKEAQPGTPWFSSVYFRRESEPYITVAVAGTGRDSGVTLAEVNLKFIWDVISLIKVGQAGYAYVVDSRGWLIAHPDIGLVLRQSDFSKLPQVAAALDAAGEPDGREPALVGADPDGRPVLTAHAVIAPLAWTVFVDLPKSEAFAPVYSSLLRTAILVLLGLGLAVVAGLFLARLIVTPITILQQTAARIGHGDLGQRIDITTGDELEVLAEQFNDMAGRLQDSYANLEHKVEVRTRELNEALQQQTATADVLKVISRSTFDLQTVLDTLTESAAQLCRADMAGITRPVGEDHYYATNYNISPDWLAYVKEIPLRRDRGSIVGRVLLDRDVVQVADVLADPDYTYSDPARKAGYRTFLGVPLLREGEAIGVLVLARNSIAPFTDKQIELLVTFADQAVIAIENARLFGELHESLHQQTATADVLKAISQSAFDLDRIFQVVGENSLRLCGADKAFIFRFDGEVMRGVFAKNASPELLDFIARNPIRPGRHTATARAALLRQTVYIEDVSIDPEFTYGARDVESLRTTLSVPILKGDELLGVITIYRLEVKPFSEHQIALVETFADQAAIAIEQVRLLTDLREALQQQTAMADMLRAISRSTFDLPSVLSTLVAAAVELCGADQGTIVREQNGNFVRVASQGFSPEFMAAALDKPVALDRGSASGRALLDRRVIHIPDITLDPDYEFAEALQHGGFRTLIGVPMLRDGTPIGVLTMSRRKTRPFTEKEIELVSSFADQAAIAIENARLFEEVQARNRDLNEALEQQTATAEILGEISRSPTDLQPVFDMIAQSAARLSESQFCFVADYDGTLVHFMAQHGLPAETVEALRSAYPLPPSRASVAARTILSGRVEQIPDIDADADYDLQQIDKSVYRSMLGVPILKDGRPVGAVVVGRSQTGVFAERQIKLLETFADQAVIAIENVRLFTELEARNRELNEALQQQTATADVLKVISRSAFDLDSVLQTLIESATRLCGGREGTMWLRQGDNFLARAFFNEGPEFANAVIGKPFAADGKTVFGRVAELTTIVHIPDVQSDPILATTPYPKLGGYRAALGVPLLRNGLVEGVFVLSRPSPGPFSDRQIELVQTFADQAVIAIENVRLFDEVQARNSELNEALEQQTATSEILRVISSSPTDIQPVFDTIAERAARLCKARFCFVFRYDGELMHFVSSHGVSPDGIDAVRGQWPAAPGRQSTASRAVLSGIVEQIPDVHLDPDYEFGNVANITHFRSIVAVPMIRDGSAIGSIAVARSQTGLFPERQVELLKAFAGQAVIAVENVRLFTELEARTQELTAALEQQTATSEILRAISTSPSSVQPVFDTIVRNAVSLCGSLFANVFRFDGELLHFVASHNVEPGYVELLRAKFPMRPDPTQVSGRVVRSRSVVHLEDALADPDYDQRFPTAMGWRRMLGVPMLREGELVGVIVVGWADAGPVSKRQEDLLKTFADQAVIAVENVRLFDEVQARTRELAQSVEELRALGEVSQAVNSTLDLETVLNTIVAKAVQLSGTDAGSIYVLNKAHTKFKLRATYGMDEATVAAIRHSSIRRGETAIGEATEQRQPLQIADVLAAPAAGVLDVVVQAGYRSFLIVPLLGPERAIGVLVIRRKMPGVFPDSTTDLLQTFAAQSVLAVQNARLFHEIEEKSQQLELASRHKSQFLANMSHELRTPLNAILGYSELILDDIYGAVPEKARAALERVQSNGKHLLGLINDVLDLAKIEAGRLTLSLADYSMDEVVASVIAAVEALAAEKHLALTVEVPPDLPIGHGDEQRIRQVLLNLVSNAIKFTDAGEVTLSARAGDGVFHVAVSDTGPGISAEDQAKLFQEFQQADNSSTRKKGGTGLGLAISKRFIDLQGGRIWVESAPGQGSTFTFELPITVEPQEDVE